MVSRFGGIKRDRYKLQKQVASIVCGGSLGLALAIVLVTYLWPVEEPQTGRIGFIPDKSEAYVLFTRIFASAIYTGQLDIRQQVAFKVDPNKTEISYLWAVPKMAFSKEGLRLQRQLNWQPPLQLDEFEKRTPIEPFGVQLNDGTAGYYFAVEGAYPDPDLPSASIYHWTTSVDGLIENDPNAGITRLVWPVIVPFHPPIRALEVHLKLPLALSAEAVAWRALLLDKDKIIQQQIDRSPNKADFLQVEPFHAGDSSAGLVFRSSSLIDLDQSLVIIVEWPGVMQVDEIQSTQAPNLN